MVASYASPVRTRPEQILPTHLAAARHVLREGGSLRDAAQAIGATTGALDQALWRALSERDIGR